MSERTQLIVLTGRIGIGKTTLCCRLANLARSAGLDVAGILSPPRMIDGHKVGIEALDPRSGQSRLLAQNRGTDRPSTLRMGPWFFDESVFDWGNNLLRAATPCDLLVVDEMGRLELTQGQGWPAGLDAVASRAYQQALVVIRFDLLPLMPARWPKPLVIDAGSEVERRLLRERLLPAIAWPGEAHG